MCTPSMRTLLDLASDIDGDLALFMVTPGVRFRVRMRVRVSVIRVRIRIEMRVRFRVRVG